MKRMIYAIICVALLAAGAALLFSMSLQPPDEPFTTSELQESGRRALQLRRAVEAF
jgi:hypothetical protein